MKTARPLVILAFLAGCGGGSNVVLGQSDADGGGYQPCADKTCGESCHLCDPNDHNCVETGNLKYCDLHGACVNTPPICARALR